MIFSLAASVSGTIAWFTSARSGSIQAGMFSVINDAIEFDSIQLCKFEYPYVYGTNEIDYLHPEDGEVKVYNFNSAEGHNRFENTSGSEQRMNLFDPVSIEIGGTLSELYCNAVYKVTIKSASFTTVDLKVFAEHLTNKTKIRDTDIFLSDCADFDLFTQSDLDAVTGTAFYPEFIEDPAETPLTRPDEIAFFKIAYLAESRSHSNFYETNPKPNEITIHNPSNIQTVAFDENMKLTFYINVNYAPSQLSKYAIELAAENRRAIFDYVFKIG